MLYPHIAGTLVNKILHKEMKRRMQGRILFLKELLYTPIEISKVTVIVSESTSQVFIQLARSKHEVNCPVKLLRCFDRNFSKNR